jgi:hypothetical protein
MKMTEIEVQQLADTALRRPLSKEETNALESHFSEHPEAKDDWRASMLINKGLRHLPELQPSSNFTSLVLQQVRRPSAKEQRRSAQSWLHRWRLTQGIAFAILFLGVGTLFYHQHRVAERTEVARTLAAVSDVAMLFNSARPTPAMAGANPTTPSMQTLQDFDAIRSLRAVPVDLDLGLLKALE